MREKKFTISIINELILKNKVVLETSERRIFGEIIYFM